MSKSEREPKNITTLTDITLKRLNIKKQLQEINTKRRKKHREKYRDHRPMPEFKEVSQFLIWDKAQKGLSVLVSAGGTMTFRSTYKLNGEWQNRSIGRFGEMVADADPDEENINIGEARSIVANDRALAKKGTDPKQQGKQPASKDSFESVVDQFIEHYAKPRQRTWDQTERVLKRNCAAWLKRPINDITKHDVRRLLNGFKADGHGPKAKVTQAWLNKLWRWAYAQDLVEERIMDAVSIEVELNERTRVYTDDEIRAIWAAANQCTPLERDYVKLLSLLAPRKTELACMAHAHLDDRANPTLWTIPFELTKSRKTSKKKRTYLVPLPPLAQRILKGIRVTDDRVFRGLPVSTSRAGRQQLNDARLKKKLKKHGAPKDYYAHAWRHTIATWLQDNNHSEWEVSLALNHSGTGVTADYSHGYPLEVKRKLLEEWARHVGQVTSGLRVVAGSQQ